MKEIKADINEFINVKDIKTSREFAKEYLRIKSLVGMLSWRDVDVYIKKADYEKYKEVLETPPKKHFQVDKTKQPIYMFLAERGLSVKLFNKRINRGWTYEEALNTPKGDVRPSIKKRVQAFTDSKTKASGAILRGLQGKQQQALPKELNTLKTISNFLDIREENAVDEFNKLENESFTRDDRAKPKKPKKDS